MAVSWGPWPLNNACKFLMQNFWREAWGAVVATQLFLYGNFSQLLKLPSNGKHWICIKTKHLPESCVIVYLLAKGFSVWQRKAKWTVSPHPSLLASPAEREEVLREWEDCMLALAGAPPSAKVSDLYTTGGDKVVDADCCWCLCWAYLEHAFDM